MNPRAVPPLSILVADDEDGIRELLEQWFKRDGHRVALASCGEEANQLLRSGRFDLIVTDIVMPEGDGFELIAAVKQHQPRARILAISGGGKYLQSADCLKMARGLGAHGIVMKPFTWEEMRAAVDATVAPAHPATV